jgi:hypothetical protein
MVTDLPPVLRQSLPPKKEASSIEETKPGEQDEDAVTFCRFCGSKITSDAKFCPYCGVSQEKTPPPPSTAPKGSGIGKILGMPLFRLRVTVFVISLLIFTAFLFLGSQSQLSQEEATRLVEDFGEVIGPHPTAIDIASRNVFICLLLFIPLVGPGILAFVSYNTGIMAAALAQYLGSITSIEIFLTMFLVPWAWLEIAAYSLASAQSIMLLVGGFTRSLRKEAKYFLLSLALCLLLLGSAAIIEAAFIVQ